MHKPSSSPVLCAGVDVEIVEIEGLDHRAMLATDAFLDDLINYVCRKPDQEVMRFPFPEVCLREQGAPFPAFVSWAGCALLVGGRTLCMIEVYLRAQSAQICCVHVVGSWRFACDFVQCGSPVT